MRREHSAFFETLGALAARQQENQLSRTFKACFDNSLEFRSRFAKLLADRVKIKASGSDWTCTVEDPVDGRIGRLDLHLRSQDGRPVVAIESKVESPLRESQLKKYRQHGVRRLVILTKYPPQVSKRVLQRLKIVTLRWQDVHRLLLAGGCRKPVDRFLLAAFARFLEHSGMAHPGEITTKDLGYMAETIRAIGRPRNEKGRVPRNGFETASRCLDMLATVATQLRDVYPKVEKASQWGPGYSNWVDDGVKYHVLSVVLYRRPWRKGISLSLDIHIPQVGSEMFWNVAWDRNANQEFEWKKLKQFFKGNVLDPDLLLHSALAAVRKWKVSL